MEAARSSQTMAHTYQTTLGHIPKYSAPAPSNPTDELTSVFEFKTQLCESMAEKQDRDMSTRNTETNQAIQLSQSSQGL
jgi:hypothetical protein